MVARVSSERLVDVRLRALGRRLAGARAGHVRDIHQARVATRRLREALPLLTGGSKHGRKLERTVRRLTRALGPVRELDVAMQLLEELELSADAPGAAVQCLRGVMLAERQTLHEHAAAEIDRLDMPRLRRKALAAVAVDGEPGRERAIDGRAAALHRAARRADRLRGRIDEASGIYLPDRLHDVRIAIKKLRYSLELAHQASAPATARTGKPTTRTAAGQIAALKRAQELLGRMHDLEVLIARTRGVQASSRPPDLRLSADLDALVRHLETECRLLHGQYMAMRPGLLDICRRVAAAGARRRMSAA